MSNIGKFAYFRVWSFQSAWYGQFVPGRVVAETKWCYVVKWDDSFDGRSFPAHIKLLKFRVAVG